MPAADAPDAVGEAYRQAEQVVVPAHFTFQRVAPGGKLAARVPLQCFPAAVRVNNRRQLPGSILLTARDMAFRILAAG